MEFLFRNWEIFDLNKDFLKKCIQKEEKSKVKINYLNLLDFDSGLKLIR